MNFESLKIKNWFLALALLAGYSAQAEKTHSVYPGTNVTVQKLEQSAAGCVPAKSSTFLQLNNVRALIHTGGDMWWDLIGNARYEIPKGSGRTSLFAGSLWMGGVDAQGNLKVAALRFRENGTDYWPGPLTNDNTASITAEQCAKYDLHYTITRAEVDQFVGWFNAPEELRAILYPGYIIPQSILNWPAHGDVSLGQEYDLAPYVDVDGSGDYNPEQGGDYPKYDINNTIDCKTSREEKLYGDQTLWWVFNDKGNIHTESGAQSIGMEIHAQAFAFATNDEINDMTFYNYRLINRSTFKLTGTYFGQWVDGDLGYAQDDYVGCDVMRGLGYYYNGDEEDGPQDPVRNYGKQPPAVGVDFFEGPYQDNDGIDNHWGIGENEALNGLGYGDVVNREGDGIVDNERFGMRRFVYHNNTGGGGPQAMTDPSTGSDYYNYLRSIWKDGTKMTYGGTGYQSGGVECDFMFPGNSDSLNWGTGGVVPAGCDGTSEWSEECVGNTPYDRRSIQSAGPFTLEPGARNDITIGVVWARATSGGPTASVEKLRLVDDKAQALFENCFRVLNGPDAPDMNIIELDRELVITLSNRPNSNNYKEQYSERDPQIISPPGVTYDNTYNFEGYQIYQVRDSSASANDLSDPDKAVLVAQCDIKNGVTQLINYEKNPGFVGFDPEGFLPFEKVNGQDQGLKHSFRLTRDEFATGEKTMVNYKSYFYIAVAYGYNDYKKYDPNDPLQLDGQKKPYKAGRKTASGLSIRAIKAIPHKTDSEKGGLILNAKYGSHPSMTRLEGVGNGGNSLNLTSETIAKILEQPLGIAKVEQITYDTTASPVDVKVVDPKSVPNTDFVFEMLDTVTTDNLSDAYWRLIDTKNSDTVYADTSINVINEQIIPKWGLSVNVQQVKDPGEEPSNGNGFISADVVFSDPTKIWLSGIPDADGATSFNWIRSGTLDDVPDHIYDDYNPGAFLDPNQNFEQILGGLIAPYKLCARSDSLAAPAWKNTTAALLNKLENLASVDIVITSDKSKWTRCPVIELADAKYPKIGDAIRFNLRRSKPIDQDGNFQDIADTAYGMGWFPGYAINIETGERLNMMYGEDSWLAGENGTDMVWNPTSNLIDGFNTYFGGKHYVYVMGHNGDDPAKDCPAYDGGAWLFKTLVGTPADALKRNVYKDVMWVYLPLLFPDKKLLESDLSIKIRTNKSYKTQLGANWLAGEPVNSQRPRYGFNTSNLAAVPRDNATAVSALDNINVVPNPYYGYSGYETSQLDNRIKITNLPAQCKVRVYTAGGILVRTISKDNDKTFTDWDLKNDVGVPIASGVYIIHIDAPGIGEKTIKWFGSLRPIDVNNF